jgi:hypothetical protein
MIHMYCYIHLVNDKDKKPAVSTEKNHLHKLGAGGSRL